MVDSIISRWNCWVLKPREFEKLFIILWGLIEHCTLILLLFSKQQGISSHAVYVKYFWYEMDLCTYFKKIF
jgi:hypothetical protein